MFAAVPAGLGTGVNSSELAWRGSQLPLSPDRLHVDGGLASLAVSPGDRGKTRPWPAGL